MNPVERPIKRGRSIDTKKPSARPESSADGGVEHAEESYNASAILTFVRQEFARRELGQIVVGSCAHVNGIWSTKFDRAIQARL
jgi:hypothetical protein